MHTHLAGCKVHSRTPTSSQPNDVVLTSNFLNTLTNTSWLSQMMTIPRTRSTTRNTSKRLAICNLQGALKAANIVPSDNVVSTNDFLSALTNSFGAEPILFCDEDRSGNKYIDSVR